MSVEKILHQADETAFRARVPLPTEIREFIEAFQGMGNIRIDGGEAYFEFWATDLWEAARICHDVEREVNPNLVVTDPMRIERPVEVIPGEEDAIEVHDVKIPRNTPIERYDPHKAGTAVWPAEAVRVILEAHGIKTRQAPGETDI